MEHALTVICPGEGLSPRLSAALEAALEGCPARILPRLEGPLEGQRVLFAIALNEGGVNHGLYDLLASLRTRPGCLRGCSGGVLVDGPGELYTKAAGRELVLAANLAGCAFPGRPLVEATGSLQNFTVQAKNAGCDLTGAYHLAAADLVRRVLAFSPPRRERPRLLALHASSHPASNTLALWALCREHLVERCDIIEIGLRNGTLEDCAGCPYTACLHFGEQGDCFYGGTMVQEVYPAIRGADGVILLCPNYNDALPANLTAAVNRLTALYRAAPFDSTAVFALVVSGYSGGDLVASQVVSAMNMNKGFWLPPEFCVMETANDPGSAVRLPGIEARMEAFAGNIAAGLGAAEPGGCSTDR